MPYIWNRKRESKSNWLISVWGDERYATVYFIMFKIRVVLTKWLTKVFDLQILLLPNDVLFITHDVCKMIRRQMFHALVDGYNHFKIASLLSKNMQETSCSPTWYIAHRQVQLWKTKTPTLSFSFSGTKLLAKCSQFLW